MEGRLFRHIANCLFVHHLLSLSMSLHVHVVSCFSIFNTHDRLLFHTRFKFLCLTNVETRLLKETNVPLGSFLCREI